MTSIGNNVNLYLSIEDLVLPSTDTIRMKATLYLREDNN